MEPNAASVALLAESRVLLICRAFAPYAGLWTLPGGRREPRESIEATAIREVEEELQIVISDLLPVLTMPPFMHFRLQVFASRNFSGTIVASDEVAAWRWVQAHEVAALETTPGLSDVIAHAFKSAPP